MKKLVTTFVFALIALTSYSQYYTGYYVSAPQVHSFDHFTIKQEKDSDSKLEGDMVLHAFCTKRQELWEFKASYIDDAEQREYLIGEYGGGKNIISVHFLKFLWDGNEWEYFLLGYIGEDKHRHFVVIEEIFNDESETELLEFNTFDWVKGHHLAQASSH